MILTLPLAATLPQGTRLISMADSAAEQYLLVIGIRRRTRRYGTRRVQ